VVRNDAGEPLLLPILLGTFALVVKFFRKRRRAAAADWGGKFRYANPYITIRRQFSSVVTTYRHFMMPD
jgi:hypothetical protein